MRVSTTQARNKLAGVEKEMIPCKFEVVNSAPRLQAVHRAVEPSDYVSVFVLAIHSSVYFCK